MTTVTESEELLDLNDHIGENRRGFEEVIVAHGFGVRIMQEGERILELCQSKELRVINMTFKKKDREKKITYKSREAETQIDLIYTAIKKARDMGKRL